MNIKLVADRVLKRTLGAVQNPVSKIVIVSDKKADFRFTAVFGDKVVADGNISKKRTTFRLDKSHKGRYLFEYKGSKICPFEVVLS